MRMLQERDLKVAKHLKEIEDILGGERMNKKEMEFKFEKATKNTYRFQEKSSGTPIIGTLYVQTSVFGSEEPGKVKVTMEWQEGEGG